jgi:hypothetical protein
MGDKKFVFPKFQYSSIPSFQFFRLCLCELCDLCGKKSLIKLEEKMKRFFLLLTGLIVLAATLAACAPSRVEMDYGTSFKLQKFNQTADFEAGKKVEPVEGMDGKAAQATTGKYQKGFEKEPPAQVFNLSIGGIK